MPTVLRVRAYRFFFASLDRGEPPHVHVRRGNAVAKIWLDPVALVRDGGFARQELTEIVRLTRDHQRRLLESWHAFFGS